MPQIRANMYILVALLCVCIVTHAENATEKVSSTSPSPAGKITNTTEISQTSGPKTSITDFSQTTFNNITDQKSDYISIYSGDHESDSKSQDDTPGENNTTQKISTITSKGTEKPKTMSVTPSVKSSTTGASQGKAVHAPSMSGGIVVLILILIIVIVLGVLLYILWRKGRTYSFDLTYASNDHDTPLRSMEHGGTFEPTGKELESLGYIPEDKPHEDSPVANGYAGDTTEQAANSEQKNVPEEDSFTSDASLTPPVKKVEFNLDLDLIGREPEPPNQDTDQPTDPQQNENNNNVTNAGNNSMDVFTEINLDEPQ